MDTSRVEDVAAALSAAFGTQRVSPECCAALRELLPGAVFVRASVRCGSGLFVTGDLLQPGSSELSVASLKNSLGGLAMARGQPIAVAAPTSAAAPASAQVLCMPVALNPAAGQARGSGSQAARAGPGLFSASQPSSTAAAAAGGHAALAAPPARPLYVGALMVGAPQAREAPSLLWQRLHALASAAAPYFLLLGLTKAADMAHLLKLRAADCSCCAEEDDLQDLPISACTPARPPPPSGGGAGAGAQPSAVPAAAPSAAAVLDLSRASSSTDAAHSEALHAAAAAALARQSSLERSITAADVAAAAPTLGSAASSSSSGSGSGSGRGPKEGLGPFPKLLQPEVLRAQEQSELSAQQAEEETGGLSWKEQGSPKAALKQHLAAGGSHSVAPPLFGPLLRYADPQLEARFAAAYNAGLRRGDALFALLHLLAVLRFALLEPAVAAAAGGGVVAARVAAPLALLLLMALLPGRYVRYREPMLAAVLLAHAALLRITSPLRLLSLPGWASPTQLHWLLRATGADAVAVLSLGFKLRFSVFLPIQALCLSVAASALPLACQTTMQEAVCVPTAVSRPNLALLLGLGLLLPAAAVYYFEARARQRFHQATAAAAWGPA